MREAALDPRSNVNTIKDCTQDAAALAAAAAAADAAAAAAAALTPCCCGDLLQAACLEDHSQAAQTAECCDWTPNIRHLIHSPLHFLLMQN
jgi:hypothetical protein